MCPSCGNIRWGAYEICVLSVIGFKWKGRQVHGPQTAGH
jgi:hypothetical protein